MSGRRVHPQRGTSSEGIALRNLDFRFLLLWVALRVPSHLAAELQLRPLRRHGLLRADLFVGKGELGEVPAILSGWRVFFAIRKRGGRIPEDVPASLRP